MTDTLLKIRHTALHRLHVTSHTMNDAHLTRLLHSSMTKNMNFAIYICHLCMCCNINVCVYCWYNTKFVKNMFWKTQLSSIHDFTTLLKLRQRVLYAMATVVLLLVILDCICTKLVKYFHPYTYMQAHDVHRAAQSRLKEICSYRGCRQVNVYLLSLSYVITTIY